MTQPWESQEEPPDEGGATAVEYGLMVALIALAVVVTVGLLGTALDTSLADHCVVFFGAC